MKTLKPVIIKCEFYCEAQGKGRAKGRPRKVTQRSFIDGGWWMTVSYVTGHAGVIGQYLANAIISDKSK